MAFLGFSGALLTLLSVINPYGRPPRIILLSCIVYVLGSIPAFLYLWSGLREAIPLMPIHAYFYAVSFGLVGFTLYHDPNPVLNPSENARATALLYTAAGLVAMLVSYYGVGRCVFRRPPDFSPSTVVPEEEDSAVVPEEDCEGLAWIAFSTVLCILVVVNVSGIRFLDQALVMLLNFCIALFVVLFFSGRLSWFGKAVFWMTLVPMKMFLKGGLSDGTLAGPVVMLVALGVIYMSVRKKVPWTWFAAAVLVVAIFQPVKIEFRQATWGRPGFTTGEKMSLFMNLAVRHYSGLLSDSHAIASTKAHEATISRVAHLVVTSTVIEATPERIPYAYGETYLPLLTKWMPRAIWPEKPREVTGNAWAHAYGALGANDHTTSFNLPWLTEFYMNFGVGGILFGMFAVGFLFAGLRHWLWQSPHGTAEFAYGFALAQAVMFPESNLSLLLGGAVIGAIGIQLFLRISRLFLGRQA